MSTRDQLQNFNVWAQFLKGNPAFSRKEGRDDFKVKNLSIQIKLIYFNAVLALINKALELWNVYVNVLGLILVRKLVYMYTLHFLN